MHSVIVLARRVPNLLDCGGSAGYFEQLMKRPRRQAWLRAAVPKPIARHEEQRPVYAASDRTSRGFHCRFGDCQAAPQPAHSAREPLQFDNTDSQHNGYMATLSVHIRHGEHRF